MDAATLSLIWFALLGVLLTGYAILDGFDLGVGILHPFVPKTDEEQRITLNSIGPLWDGNEVWLITFGGALFAADQDGRHERRLGGLGPGRRTIRYPVGACRGGGVPGDRYRWQPSFSHR